MLQHLYRISPNQVKTSIAQQCGLSDAQLLSWLRSLTIVRNYAAHHARMFNRIYSIRPKLNDDPRLQAIESATNRAFGQLSLNQYLHRELGLSSALVLPKVLNSYPQNNLVPFERTGAPVDWKELELWKPI